MMKFFAAAFVAIVAVSCVKEMGTESPKDKVKMVDVTFGADLDDLTKTISGTENDAPAVLWTEGDKVAVYDSLSAKVYEFTLCGGIGTSAGVFTGQLPETSLKAEKQAYVMVYPFEAVVKYHEYSVDDERHQIDVTPMVEQPATPGSFAEEANLSAGLTRNLGEGVVMYSLPSYIKIGLEGSGITSVTVYDNNNMNCVTGSGRVNVHAYRTNRFWNPASGSSSQNRVTLIPASGTEIAAGTYYLTHRPAGAFSKGMTLKFTNADGRAAYYSTDDAPNSDKGKTIPVGTWNAESLNWKQVEEFTVSFTSWPFEETAADNRLSGTYTIAGNGRQVSMNTSADRTSNGLLFNTAGDYIEFPAVPGKRLREVQVYTAGNGLKGTVLDADGNIVGGAEYSLYGSNYYTFIIPHSEINTKYRYQVTTTNSTPRIKTIRLTYAGDDVAEISGVNATVENSFTGFTVKGELQGSSLDAASWGVEYGTSAEVLSEAATGNGGKIDQLVEAAAGTYYVRVWASADNGANKTYSDVMTVEVKPFSGTITFDFSSPETVTTNITYVGTTGSSAPATASDITKFVSTVDGVSDYYTYSTPEAVWPFTILCRDTDATNDTGYGFAIDSSGYGIRMGNSGTRYCMMSIPVVKGYRLNGFTTYCTTNSGRFAITSSNAGYSTDRLYYTERPTGSTAPYEYTVDLTDMSNTDETQCWLSVTNNRVFTKFIFKYEKLN